MSSLSSTTTSNKHVNSSSSAATATCNPGELVEEGTSRAASARPACAACKHQRRKCAVNCLLAPYFPAHQQQQFLNAHHLYGVKNITRFVRGLDPIRRDNAMYSIIYESNARASDPVGGCLRIICELERQLQHESSELMLILRQLTICQMQAAKAAATGIIPGLSTDDNLVVDTNNVIDNGDGNAAYTILQHDMQQQYVYGHVYDCNAYPQDSNNKSTCNDNAVISNSNSNNSGNNCNANISESDNGVVLKLHAQATLPTLDLELKEGKEDELKSVDLGHDIFDVIKQQSFHYEPNSSDHVDVTSGESFGCRLGLGFT